MARHSGETRFLADVVTTQSAEAAARLSRRGGTCKGGARQIHAPRTARKVIWACCSVMIHAASGSMNVTRRLEEKVDHERKNLDSSGAVDICVGRGTGSRSVEHASQHPAYHGRRSGQPASCYGDTRLATPRLDALAGEGLRFTRAFVTQSSCSSSRSSILTGLYPHQNGQYGLAHLGFRMHD